MAQAIALIPSSPSSSSRFLERETSSVSLRSSQLDQSRENRSSRSNSPRVTTSPRRIKSQSQTDENRPPTSMSHAEMEADKGHGGAGAWRDGSIEADLDASASASASSPGGVRQRKNPPRSARPSGANADTATNGLHTLETIPDPDYEDGESALSERELSPSSPSKPPPPAPSTQTGTGERPVMTRKRRSSSVKRKLSPGVTPTKAVDWEIPRKTLHSSIGFLTLFLNYLDPPTLRPLIAVLTSTLVTVCTVDFFRLRFPAFAEIWEQYLGFLMRESERQKINGVVWYLVGVIFVLALYPRDVAVVAILTLSWSDTTASTIGRLWGRHTPPLPSHVPGIKYLPFARRKSLAGFLAATITGFLICTSFWWNGSGGRWTVLEVGGHAHWGLWVTAVVVGLGGAVVEALDLGLDDNLTLPILSGALVWFWLATTNLIL